MYGCRECDRIEPSLEFMLYHKCTKNGKSKYEQHQQEALNRQKEKEKKLRKKWMRQLIKMEIVKIVLYEVSSE